MRDRGFVVIILAAFLLLPSAAHAQQKQQQGIELRSTAEVEVRQANANGPQTVTRIDAAKTKVLPGEAVIFTSYYTYHGDKPATNVAIKNPVPDHMVYVDGSAEGKNARIEFSADKGKTFAPAGKVKFKGPDGIERMAGAKDYTTIRWTIERPLHKGEKGSVSFRATVK